MGVSRSSALRALKEAGVPLIAINQNAMAVDEADLQSFLAARAAVGYKGRGRPRKVPEKPLEAPVDPSSGVRLIIALAQPSAPTPSDAPTLNSKRVLREAQAIGRERRKAPDEKVQIPVKRANEHVE